MSIQHSQHYDYAMFKKTCDEMVPIDNIIHFDNIKPMNFSEPSHYRSKQLVLCHDNKIRI